MAKHSTNDHERDDRCACAATTAGGDRKAVSVDPEIKEGNLRRLRRIEGQIRGVQRMIEDERYCSDILVQVSAINEALRTVSRELLRNHLRHCATHAIHQSPEAAEAMYDEILGLFARYSR